MIASGRSGRSDADRLHDCETDIVAAKALVKAYRSSIGSGMYAELRHQDLSEEARRRDTVD
jgi:hypothetical protein